MNPHQKPQEDVVGVSATAVGAIESLTRRVVFAEPTVLTNEHIDAFSSGRPVPGAVDEPKLIGALMGADNAYARGYEAGRRDMREAAGWQPIETAPKEVWAQSQQVLTCHAEKRWTRFGRYYGEMKRWYYSGTSERSQWAEVAGDAPTHWMPFPALPTEPLGGEG